MPFGGSIVADRTAEKPHKSCPIVRDQVKVLVNVGLEAMNSEVRILLLEFADSGD